MIDKMEVRRAVPFLEPLRCEAEPSGDFRAPEVEAQQHDYIVVDTPSTMKKLTLTAIDMRY